MNAMRLLITGPPGSGKGTFAELLCKKTNLHHLSTGDLLREEIKKGGALGKEIKDVIDRGDFVSDDLVNKVVKENITKEEIRKGFLLDGHPRSVMQAEFLTNIEHITGIILITLPDEVIIDRLSKRRICPKCGTTYHLDYNPPKKEGLCNNEEAALIQRDDDKPEVIAHRMKVYKEQTLPVVTYLKKHNIPVIEIQGNYDIKTEGDQLIQKIIDWQEAS